MSLLNVLKVNPSNPRNIEKKAFEKLKKSIIEFPEMLEKRPIVYDETNTILGGNMRFKALQELEKNGFEIKDSYFLKVDNWTDEQKKEFVIKDNVEMGDWDYDILANEWSDLPLDEWGIDVSGWEKEVEEDEVPELPEEAVSKLGEVYHLGKHRLMCGDATKIEDVEKLMNGQKADMVFTDPPYNVNYKGGSKGKKVIKNDFMSTDNFYDFLYDSISNMMKYCSGNFYIFMSIKEMLNLKAAFENAGGHWQSFIIWVKNTFTFSRADYQNQYEPILYGWNSQNKNHYFAGFRDVGNVWYETKNKIIYKDGKTTIRIGDIKLELDGKVSGKLLKRKVKTDIWDFDKPTKAKNILL